MKNLLIIVLSFITIALLGVVVLLLNRPQQEAIVLPTIASIPSATDESAEQGTFVDNPTTDPTYEIGLTHTATMQTGTPLPTMLINAPVVTPLTPIPTSEGFSDNPPGTSFVMITVTPSGE